MSKLPWPLNPGLTEQELRRLFNLVACPFSNHEPRAYRSFWGWRLGCEFCGVRTAAFPQLEKAVRQWNSRWCHCQKPQPLPTP